MAVFLAEATKHLLNGQPLSWSPFEEHKGGSVTLDTAGKRRLFAFLLAQEPAKVAGADEDLFGGIIAAWNDDGVDPAEGELSETLDSSDDVWRLERIEASGFGGLTLFGGPPFDLQVKGENWCLNGQNGSGKTSLVSAILWALTGQRIREQEGPVDEHGERSAVTTNTGKRLGDWPAIASYPPTAADLLKPAEVWVRLTFSNQEGELARAYRQLTCPPNKDAPKHETSVDARLLTASQLLETGLLMPARLARIGFGEKSRSLYEAVKMLTGLDQLADIAEGCGHLTHGGRRFLKYGKDQGLERWGTRFAEDITKVLEKADEVQLVLPQNLALGRETLVADLKEAADSVSASAGAYLATLKSEIAPTIDTTTAEGRTAIRNAVSAARATVNQRAKGIPLFEAWTALHTASDDPAFADVSRALHDARTRLDRALSWHAKQEADRKFRLKAVAAQFFVPPHDHSGVAQCPLCNALLSSADQKALTVQLTELQKDSAEAERRLDDVCIGLEAELEERLPSDLRKQKDSLASMDPTTAYAVMVRERFCDDVSFGPILVGLAKKISAKVAQQEAALPSFLFPRFEPVDAEPESATRLRRTLHHLDRLLVLVAWWADHRDSFRSAWLEVLGQQEQDRSYPLDSVEVQLRALEDALANAYPLDEIAKLLGTAAMAAEKWGVIRKEQDLREGIADALEPLKDLRLLVAAETARSIASLSERIKTILGRIHLRERLSYEDTSLGKKQLHVGGSFEPGMQIDAALVANTSWLRAILWAFLLALREQTLETLGANPFPLMVLDDPQTTFDPRNKRQWAQELARLANLDPTAPEAIQLFLATHERQFYQCMVDVEKLRCEQGLIGGVNKTSCVATIVNAGWLQEAWRKADEGNDDALARDYIGDVRIYCEDLLKFMLRAESPKIPDLSLDSLRGELKRLHEAHVAPFDRKPFRDLANTLMGGGGRPMTLINEVHHKDDETIGIAQAREVKEFWDKKLMDQIHEAFAVYDQFESFYGEPRTFPWAKAVVPFPSGFREEVETLTLLKTGIAAAAKSDGHAGDGVVTVKEWTTPETIKLHNHEVFQLAAGTLDPVGAIGDLVLVCNHAKVNPRNLVVATYGSSFLARRYNEVEAHPEVRVLTGQSVDPYALPEPRIVAPETAHFRKIVGTIFAAHRLPTPPCHAEAEVIPLTDANLVREMLDGSRLFEVQGRSAEPIALEGQFLITREPATTAASIRALDRRPVIAIDDDGTRYFKRLSCRGQFALLESLNPDGTTPAEILSFNGTQGLPRLAQALEVIGVLFDMPEA